MFDVGIFANSPAPAWGITLYNIWEVRANFSYNIIRHIPNNNLKVCIRTDSGHGFLLLNNGQRYDLKKDSLLVVDQSLIRHYRTVENKWNFHWYEFQAIDFFVEPYKLVENVPNDKFEATATEQMKSNLTYPTHSRNQAASAIFSAMLRVWNLQYTETQSKDSETRCRIEKVIGQMKRQSNRNMTASEMAKLAGMGERTFRNTFKAITGRSPKQYFDLLRMEYARALIANGKCNVSQTADMLGFSSPFYFSSVFKKICGKPPSQV
jgi:AraC-like DNA-binding protein